MTDGVKDLLAYSIVYGWAIWGVFAIIFGLVTPLWWFSPIGVGSLVLAYVTYRAMEPKRTPPVT